jgi:hypothetical protein
MLPFVGSRWRNERVHSSTTGNSTAFAGIAVEQTAGDHLEKGNGGAQV